MKNRYCFIIMLLLTINSCSLFENKLLNKIVNTDNTELAKLSFFELNILKNSIFSLQGYKYANDRPWLYKYFYNYKGNKIKSKTWDMNKYEFISPEKAGKLKLNKNMQKAIANVRVALYKKIRSYKDIDEIDKAIDQDYVRHGNYIFGRKLQNANEFLESIRREVHGYKRIINIIDNNSNFDACELLGVYIGSVVLLKNVIEAKNGKEFRGVLGWEISQLVGITPKDSKYSFKKLPEIEKEKILRLIMVKKRLQSSGIGDIPDELKTDAISIETKEIIREQLEDEESGETYDEEDSEDRSHYHAAC